MTTIKDISKVAGVSVTTVSRALNGYSDVNEETRKKILEIAKQLNYSPNTLARGLVMKKSQTIGLLVSGMNRESVKDNLTFQVLCGINECVSVRNYDLILFNTDSTRQREKTYTQLCRERKVDGVIIQGIKLDDPYLKEVMESDIPCVLVDIPVETNTVGYVTTDNVLGAKKAVEHLIELGHQNIAMVNGSNQAFVSKQRLKGYEIALKENGIKVKRNWIVDGEFKEEMAKEVVLSLLSSTPEITAIFCASDLMAMGALKACQEQGLVVPNDISIIGYDDILLASYVTPSLTTIKQDMFEMGYEAADLLVDMLEGKAKKRHRILETKLVQRESCTRI
ncbi:LacI family DNA-binding transcriptional regulator [Neobacillus thermocopriae]|uniref:LacI family transcriptional regulator n=1 Tax=Neobacillus thermocopriae TaxID=1215031 RepID=A0A6B3TUH9_9BACI|nr:LacI family DNA-binding transcriptional regulator [Neobacillus thermocopriae]MED3623019.1 LacI family DNA-binding transcriptional regulator [Neobacillus thermocopriae]MED3714914.1 LacI family DNA-binding transcriptional regulator [Neobacillus thermocopriae]NEX79307.1 LacI family transcriptional regulator [Neobacillus thermocopriae]